MSKQSVKVPLDMLYERLAVYDPNEVLELLKISTDDLLAAFKSRIKLYRDILASELDIDIENAFLEDDAKLDEYDVNQVDDYLYEESSGDDSI